MIFHTEKQRWGVLVFISSVLLFSGWVLFLSALPRLEWNQVWWGLWWMLCGGGLILMIRKTSFCTPVIWKILRFFYLTGLLVVAWWWLSGWSTVEQMGLI